MAMPHAHPLDVIDLKPLGGAIRDAVTTSLLKTPALQLMRMVLQAGQRVPEHHVAGAITVHCLEGEVVISTPSRECHISAGQLVMLEGGEPHALAAAADSSLLVTVLLQTR